jgi:hypothetical protein
MAISDNDKFLLDNMALVSTKVKLGTLIRDAEQGGLADNAVTSAKIAADAVTNAKIADDAVSLEQLDSGIEMSHVVKYAGKATTVGGAAAEAITVTGVAATDVVIVTLQTEGGTPRSIVKAVPSTNTITVTFSGDPAADHIVAYQVLRAAS